MTTECEALRAEVALLADENRRLLNEILELRKTPVYPEAAVRAVWEDGHWRTPALVGWDERYEKIARIFTEALKNGN
jgi:regulator of replication initiation timing